MTELIYSARGTKLSCLPSSSAPFKMLPLNRGQPPQTALGATQGVVKWAKKEQSCYRPKRSDLGRSNKEHHYALPPDWHMASWLLLLPRVPKWPSLAPIPQERITKKDRPCHSRARLNGPTDHHHKGSAVTGGTNEKPFPCHSTNRSADP